MFPDKHRTYRQNISLFLDLMLRSDRDIRELWWLNFFICNLLVKLFTGNSLVQNALVTVDGPVDKEKVGDYGLYPGGNL